MAQKLNTRNWKLGKFREKAREQIIQIGEKEEAKWKSAWRTAILDSLASERPGNVILIPYNSQRELHCSFYVACKKPYPPCTSHGTMAIWCTLYKQKKSPNR